jgi:hypothetical protein
MDLPDMQFQIVLQGECLRTTGALEILLPMGLFVGVEGRGGGE